MTSPALAERCAELRQPMLDVIRSGTHANLDAAAAPAFLADVETVQAVLARGTGAVVEPDYLAWHPVAVATLHRMHEAIRTGDVPEAWTLFKDPNVGFFALGQACQGCPGW